MLTPQARLSGEQAWAVRPSVIARALSLPETTARRRLREASGPGKAIIEGAGGYRVSLEWLATKEAAAISEQSLSNLRRVVNRAAAHGFPVTAPASAYVVRRPPELVLN